MLNLDSDNDDFDSKTEAFMTWLQQRPGATISPKIRIADLRHIGAGRGVVAVEDIEDDEELFSITSKDVLSVANSSLSSTHAEVYKHLDPWNALILTMIYEDGQGKASEWWAYLELLPTEFDTLMHWSTQELAELQGSAVLEKIGKDAGEQSFIETLLPIVQKNCHLFGTHAAVFQSDDAALTLISLGHRMATLIMAYAFDLESDIDSGEEDGEEDDLVEDSSQQENVSHKGMVPLADLFNADGDLNNAHLIQSESSMTMVALKPIKKGDQIFNDFGQLPRSDLLRRYGYVTDRYKKWDVVEIDLGLVSLAVSDSKEINKEEMEERLALAEECEVLQDGYDLGRPTRPDRFDFDDNLILTMTTLLLDTADYEKAVASPQVPDRPPAYMRMSLLTILKSIIAKRTEAYRTIIAEDTTLLTDKNVSGRHRMAVEVRLGEKEILVMAAHEVDQRLAKLQELQNETNGSTNPKKRKL